MDRTSGELDEKEASIFDHCMTADEEDKITATQAGKLVGMPHSTDRDLLVAAILSGVCGPIQVEVINAFWPHLRCRAVSVEMLE